MMKIKLLGIFVCMLLMTTALPALGVVKESGTQNITTFMLDELDQQSTKSDKVYAIGPSDKELAQSFTPTLPRLTKVILRLKSTGSADFYYYYVDIKSSLIGSALTTASIHRDILIIGTGFYEFDFPDISVTTGIKYYIILRGVSTSGDSSKVWWWYGYPDPYGGGDAWYESISGWNYLQEGIVRCDFCFQTYGSEEINPPNKPTTPIGFPLGTIGVSYTYESSTIDNDGDQIYYLFDWGDSTDSGWVGPYDSGDICQESHVWSTKGSYSIKVKAKDTFDAESVWSDPLPIIMPYSYKPILRFLELLFQRFPYAFPILRNLLEY